MLKLGLDLGDRIDLIESVPASAPPPVAIERVAVTVDQTRDSGARLIVRDLRGNGVTAWLELGDSIHLDGHFSAPVRIELDKHWKQGAKLMLKARRSVKIKRVKLRQQHEPGPRKPGPLGSPRVASAAQLDMCDRVGDWFGVQISVLGQASICSVSRSQPAQPTQPPAQAGIRELSSLGRGRRRYSYFTTLANTLAA